MDQLDQAPSLVKRLLSAVLQRPEARGGEELSQQTQAAKKQSTVVSYSQLQLQLYIIRCFFVKTSPTKGLTNGNKVKPLDSKRNGSSFAFVTHTGMAF